MLITCLDIYGCNGSRRQNKLLSFLENNMQPGTFVWAAFRDEPESFVNFSCINFKWRAEWYPETMKFVLYNKTIESPAKKIYRMT